MFVKNLIDRELTYRNKVTLKPNTVTYVDDALVSAVELKDAYGERIEIISHVKEEVKAEDVIEEVKEEIIPQVIEEPQADIEEKLEEASEIIEKALEPVEAEPVEITAEVPEVIEEPVQVSLRLKDPVTHRLQRDAFEQFKQECIEEGFRDGQFKVNLLMQDEKRHAKFKKLVLE